MSDYAVVNPATGETVARYDQFTDAQVEDALARAQAAFEGWRTVPVAERAAIVRRAAELHRERRKELAAIITREMGKLFGIMPWNFPYYQVARFAAPNLVLGNVIVLKHSSQFFKSAATIEKIYRD